MGAEERARWRRCVYKVLERRYKRLLFKTPTSASLHFRLSRAYFGQERYMEALAILDDLCAQQAAKPAYWHWQSKCNMRLYQQSGEHVFVEKAFNGLKMAIQTTPLSMAIVCQLPPLLHELAQLYEGYGALDAAMSVYGQIAAMFPNYSQLLEVLHRCSIVMLALAEIPGAPKDKLIARAMRISKRVLEHAPAGDRQLSIAFTHARACEQSKSEKALGKKDTAYEHLFALAQSKGIAAAEHQDWHTWAQNAESWLSLGRHLRDSGEKRLAAASMDMYAQRVKAMQEDDDEVHIEIPVCLEIAQNYAELQDLQPAIEMAATALAQDHFHPQARQLLGEWSERYAEMFSREKTMVTFLTSAWRGRIFSKRYLDKYKHVMLAELEEQVIANPFDMAVRRQLAYFARDKWRAQFLYEEKCATQIQHAFRESKALRQWKAQQRNKMLGRAANVYAEYKLNRFDHQVRQRVRQLVRNKYCPKRHIINTLPAQFQREEAAVVAIQQAFRCHRAKMELLYRRQGKIDAALAFRNNAADMIIRLFKKRYHRRLNARRRVHRRTQHRAAALLQRHYRTIRFLPAHRQWAAEMEELRRIRRVRRHLFKWLAIAVAKFLHFRHRYHRKLAAIFSVQIATRRWLGRCRRKRLLAYYAGKIQRRWLFRRDVANIRDCVDLLLRKRREQAANSETGLCAVKTQQLLSTIRDQHTNSYYSPPGLLTNSPEFLSLSKKVAVICNGRGGSTHRFEPSDGVMLGAAARSGILNLRVVVFEEVILTDSNKCKPFLRGLAALLTQCMYLKALVFVRCTFSPETLQQLVQLLPVHARRLLDLRFEGCANISGLFHSHIVLSTLTDYFFHTNAALHTLSLSGLELDDSAAAAISKATGTWQLLRSVMLANNAITDNGARCLLQVLVREPVRLQLLDLSGNHIHGHATREFIRSVHRNSKISPVEASTSGDELIRTMLDLITQFLHGATLASRPRSPSDGSTPHIHINLSCNALSAAFHRLLARHLRLECSLHVQHIFHVAAGRRQVHNQGDGTVVGTCTCPAAIALDGHSRKEMLQLSLQQSGAPHSTWILSDDTKEALRLCNISVSSEQ